MHANNTHLKESTESTESLKGTLCFVVPPHIERKTNQQSDDICDEVRRRRIGARVFRRSLSRAHPKNDNLDDQDVFSAKGTFSLPGWKLADTDKEADYSYNNSVNPCWDNTQAVIAFYKNVLKFDLKTHLDGQVVSTVDFGKRFNNAFFNGDQMAYGEGDGNFFKDFCFDHTVVCHELGHGVVDATIPLIYKDDSGALNESFADVFAICFHHYTAKKRFSKLTPNDWMVGEKCVVGKGALRSFTTHTARDSTHPLGPDMEPRHLRDKYTGKEDNGGVHINSSIINHAFYRFCKHMGGKTWEKPLKLWFSILDEKLITPYASFEEFSKALLTKARSVGKKHWWCAAKALKDVGFDVVIPKVRRRKKKRVNSNKKKELIVLPLVQENNNVNKKVETK